MKQPQRLVRLGRRIRMCVRQGTQVKVVRIEAVWPLAPRTIDLGTADGRLDCSDDLRRQLVLQIEDVRDRTTKFARPDMARPEEHTSELQSLMRISYAVFCLKTTQKKK